MVDLLEIKKRGVMIGQALEQSKATNVVVLDVHDICSWGSVLVLATGGSAAQMKGLLNELDKLAKEQNWEVPGVRKKEMDSSWILLDWKDLVIHIFSPEGRDFYALDGLWYQGESLYSSKSS